MWAARILIDAAVLQGMIAVLSAFFKAFNRPLVPSVAQLISFAVAAAGSWTLLPRYQYLGAAWVSLISATVGTLFLLGRLRRDVGQGGGLFRPTTEDWSVLVALIRRLSSARKVVPLAVRAH